MEVTAEMLQEYWNKLMGFVELYITGERKEELKELYAKYEERLMFAPASAREHYHNAFPGGLLLHTVSVVDAALRLYEVWKESGANVSTFTVEELVFCALNHDLGKIGDENYEYYIPLSAKDDWKRKNGDVYSFNPQTPYMNVSDRTLFLLQRNGIIISQNEFLGIYLADGLYEEKNEPYLKTFNKDFVLRTNLPYIIHQADMVAMRSERDLWLKENEESFGVSKIDPATSPKKSRSNPQVRNEAMKDVFKASPNATAVFEELFKKNK